MRGSPGRVTFEGINEAGEIAVLQNHNPSAFREVIHGFVLNKLFEAGYEVTF